MKPIIVLAMLVLAGCKAPALDWSEQSDCYEVPFRMQYADNYQYRLCCYESPPNKPEKCEVYRLEANSKTRAEGGKHDL